MSDNYVIDAEVEVDGDAYDDAMGALTHLQDLFDQSDDIKSFDLSVAEDPSE